jgi:hypothetical protein
MKRDLVLDYLWLLRKKRPAGLVKKPKGIQRRPDVPEPPAPTL